LKPNILEIPSLSDHYGSVSKW